MGPLANISGNYGQMDHSKDQRVDHGDNLWAMEQCGRVGNKGQGTECGP